jgi:hypothetical protein
VSLVPEAGITKEFVDAQSQVLTGLLYFHPNEMYLISRICI